MRSVTTAHLSLALGLPCSFARCWLACHEEISAILGEPLPPKAAQVSRSITDRRGEALASPKAFFVMKLLLNPGKPAYLHTSKPA